MAGSHPWRLYESIDYDSLVESYPPPEEFVDGIFTASREEIRELQEERLQWKVEQAWEVPFYRELWEDAGVSPDDINGLEDLNKLPIYDVTDINDSLERAPPTGDYHDVSLHEADDAPLRMFFSGGTTGDPRPQLYTPKDREVQAIQQARFYYLSGLRPGDVTQLCWDFSTHNGGWIIDRALHHWLGVTSITTGTGNDTSSEQQLYYMDEYDVDAVEAFPNYLMRLAEVAEEQGLNPEEDFDLKTLPTHGQQHERDRVEDTWGAPAHNGYGTHEVGLISSTCEHQAGMHIFEDLFIVQIVDPETGEEVEPGERGEVVVTELYKTGAPQVRYNLQDISRLHIGECECGSQMHRLEDFLGRGDNMVKVRGINVWPEAIGQIIGSNEETNGEYFCYVEPDETGTDAEMFALVEQASDSSMTPSKLQSELADKLASKLGVRINVSIHKPGEIADLTGVNSKSKVTRFEDRR
jgi:phenylacetate-CoA ligase